MTERQPENWHEKELGYKQGELRIKLNAITKQLQAIADEYKIQKGVSIEVSSGKAICIIDLDVLTIG